MADMILFLGGTRSGKSTRAEAEAMKAEGAVVYVATAKARPEDSSLQERIRRHQVRRPGHWHTLECPKGLAGGLEALLADIPDDGHPVTILIDCVTMWMANILFSLPDPEDLVALETAARQEVEELLALMERTSCRWILVSGETGLGGIQASARGRYFCDCLGMVNQLLAVNAREAWLCVAGKKILLQD